MLIAWGIAAVWYLADVLYIWFNGNNVMNSDLAAELILAKELNREGTLLSANWYYSSELRVLNTQLAYKLGFALFPDHWHAARTVAVAVLLLAMILVAVYFARAISYPLAGPILSVVLLAPYSKWYGWNVVFNSYYVPHIVLTLLALSLFLRTLQTRSGKRIVCIVLSVALAFAGGLGGVRQLMICYSPLLLAAVVYLLNFREEKVSRHRLRIFCFSLFLFAAACAGYLINTDVLCRYYTFELQGTKMWGDSSLYNVFTCLSQLIGLFGWRSEVTIVSLEGIGNVLSLLLVVLLLYGAVRCVRERNLSEIERLAVLFSLSAFAVLLAVYGFSKDMYNESYWSLFLPDAFIGLLLCLKHESANWRKYIVTFFCLGTLLINSILTYRDPYISWVPDDRGIQNAVAWLTFWNSDIITPLSNGKIEMWNVLDVDDPVIYPKLQVKSHDEFPKQGKIFVIRPMSDLTDQDPTVNQYLVGTKGHLVYQDDNYFIYSYDNSEEYLETIGGIAESLGQ